MTNERLIEEAAKAIGEAREVVIPRDDGCVSVADADDATLARAAWAVFERALTPTDDEREAPIAEVAEAFRQHEGAPTWQDDPVGRDAALRWHMRGYRDGLAAGFRRSEVPEPSAETIANLRTWIAGEPFEVSQARTGQPVAKVPFAQQQGYLNGYAAAVEHVAAILDAEPQGEPSDAQVRSVWDALGPSVTVHLDFEDLRAALRAAGGAR